MGAKLRELRLQVEMSQEKFGTAMGLSHAHVQKYEQGKNRIAVSTLVGICGVPRVILWTFLIQIFDKACDLLCPVIHALRSAVRRLSTRRLLVSFLLPSF
ncbi:helix-turn-helix domain-containing protein [Candidatus Phyllobacterium onerii]|uniref:helix-turn-helix domain-containing protein n=1 Tax=Candidatus Phyllobacterium onerii TaxID=3020828 RepID=UPI003A8B51B5